MIDKSSSYKYTVAAEQNVQEREYWSKQLSGELLKSAFPQDFPTHTSRHMEVEKRTLSPLAIEQLLKLSKGNDVKLHIILTATLFVLLHKYSGNDDMTIGSPILKQEVQLDFINTILVFRNQIKDHTSFKQLLLEVRDTIIGANKNQNYPIELFIKQLDITVPEDEFPLFDVAIWLENLYDKNFIQTIPYNIGFSFLRTGESIQGDVLYNSSLYHRTTIQQIFHHFSHLLEVLLPNMDLELSAVDILTPEERKRLLFDYNQTQSTYPEEKTLHQLFADIQACVPDTTAILGETIFLPQPTNRMSMTFHQLSQQSFQLAKQLRSRGCHPGTIVALIFEPSIEMMVGLLGILYAGAIYLPIEPNYPESRIDFILKDSDADILLTTPIIKENTPLVFDKEILFIDSFVASEDTSQPSFFPDVDPLSPAYIIYTSGTTGKPKGIITEHRQVVAYIYSFWNQFPVSAADISMQLTTYTFDLFIEEVFPTLLRGGKIVIPTKADVLDFDLLCQLIFTQQVTIIDCTPLLLNEFNNRCVPGSPHNPLASVHTFISGGDILKAEHVQNLLQIGTVYNTYGPTETTVCATYYRYSSQNNVSRSTIPIGKPIMNYQVVILDKHNHPVPVGVGGECCIGGVGVVRGYLNRPELTHDKFILFPVLSTPATRLYKTGDLTRWLADGNIEFLGRLDFQVKIRGFRIELGEIETQLLTHHLISETFVMVREEQNGEKYLCAYLVPHFSDPSHTASASDLRAFLETRLPDYMIPAYFVWLDKMPLTATGKLDRKALPNPEFKGGDHYIAPRDEIETKMVEIWSEILARDPLHASQLQSSIGIDDNFFELGGHSLRATTMMSKIHKALNVKIELVEIFKTPTIRDISRFIQGSKKDVFKIIEPTEEKEYYPLSSAQKRLYFLQQMDSTSTGYNIPLVLSLGQGIDKGKLEFTLKQLITRHESLRTSFERVNEEIVQIIHPAQSLQFTLDYYEVHTTPLTEIINGYIKPFNLSLAPLMRSALIKQQDGNYIWLVDIHHIVSDGQSHTVLVEDFLHLNRGDGPLTPLPIQYKDFVQWQNHLFESGAITAQKDYWLTLYAGEIPRLNFPTDYKRPEVFTSQGDQYLFDLEIGEVQQFKMLGSRFGGTLYMNMMAVLNTLLYKYTGQTDIIIGSGITGRQHADLQHVVGMFVNILVMRNYPRGEISYERFLQDVIANSVNAFENQDVQFEELVDKLDLERDPSRNPLFDISLVVQNFKQANNPRHPHTPNENQPVTLYKNTTAKFDLSFFLEEAEASVNAGIEYYTGIFKVETIARLATHFKNVISTIIKNPSILLKDIDILSPAEKEQLLYQFNDTITPFPQDKAIHHIFKDQVDKTPHAIALLYEDQILTYKELDWQANHLAYYLYEKTGIRSGEPVGVWMSPSLYRPIAIMSILKAGGAFVPLDPAIPGERLKCIINDACIRSVLSQKKYLEELNRLQQECHFLHSYVCLDRLDSYSQAEQEHDPFFDTESQPDTSWSSWSGPAVLPSHPAYIIYTSGTTGTPKGILIEHRSLVNLNTLCAHEFMVNGRDHIIQFANISFDASILDIFMTLMNGATLFLMTSATISDYDLFRRYMIRHGITIATLPPPYANHLDFAAFATLRILITGGSSATMDFIYQCREAGKFQYINAYGPTEYTIFATLWNSTLFPQATTVSIGKPIPNTAIYIVDSYMSLKPIGVVGELCIAGAGIARGYLNNPQLTHEQFVSHSTLSPKIYKTGDLARWLPDGNIEFLGRIDHQVKIRGFRIELGEIETRLLKHPDVVQAVVLDRKDNGESYLCAYIVSLPGQALDTLELTSYLARYLPGYMIPHYFLPLDFIPLNTSGKVNRKALPAPNVTRSEDYIPPTNPVEEKLALIWSEILALDSYKISMEANFFQLGGHSLKATLLVSKIHKELHVKVPLAEIFKSPTIRNLSHYLHKNIHTTTLTANRFSAIEPVEIKEYYPLSSAQKRLYFLQQLDPTSTSYNMTMVLPLGKSIPTQTIDAILKKLIAHHESLRTSFIRVVDEPFQKVHDHVDFEIHYFDLSTLSQQATAEMGHLFREFVRPFDLSTAPLIRSGLITMPDNHCIWLVDMHHIISDGTSQTILTEDFFSLYQHNPLPSLPLQYKDFSHWQNHLFASGTITVQQKYWLELYAGEIPRLNLPVDFERPAIFTFAGDIYNFMLEREEARAFRELGNQHGATLYMNIMAALNTLFYKYTAQTDIIIGSGIAGRPHIDLQHIVGMFVNTLALRNHPRGEKTYLAFLKEVNNISINAFENQDVQFEELVEKLDIERDPSRNPLFDISMVVQNFTQVKEASQPQITGDDIIGSQFKNTTAKFDLTFFILEAQDRVYISIEYYSAIFKEETIARLATHFKNVILSVIKNPTMTLNDIDILSPNEKEQLLYQFNDTKAPFPQDKTIHLLFAEQVCRTPDAVVLVHQEQQMTYKELDQQANRLASYLYQEKGVHDGQPVGVWMSQSIYRQVAILAILKAGGAFVPLDPAIPSERIKYIINDARIHTVLSQKYHLRDLNRLLWECHSFHSYLCVDSLDIQSEAEQEQNQLMDQELWQHVGESATDEITGGGWLSSYTGLPFSKQEMDEYGDNILNKLLPLLHSNMKVLEIGCASGISMYRIAPKVRSYYGTDLSAAIIERNKKQVQEQGVPNITLACLPAHDIHQLPEKDFQLIIVNSVIQCFHGHNYLGSVIQKAINLLGDNGYLFIGDVMNQEKKDELVGELTHFRETHRDMGYSTKTDFSAELFVAPDYWQDLYVQYHQIESVVCSEKLFSLENELTKFRYDVLIKVNKLRQTDPRQHQHFQKIKFQDDMRAVLPRDRFWQGPDIPAHYPAYIIYTSGSTGKPKGVLVEHRSLVNLCYWHNNTYSITALDRATKYAGFSFDASVWEIFPYLVSGASLYMVPEDILVDVDALNRYYQKFRITISFLPTQMCEQFMAIDNMSGHSSLRVLLTGGDKLRHYIKREYHVYNNYGPTENTVVTTSYCVTQVSDNIPIGKPIFNNQIYILDHGLHLLPIGVPGELCISGASLARGYLNNPELTHDKFMTPTITPILSTLSTKIYKTGDLARWVSDGNIQFLGRIDQQVKIRGFRIELGEIEKQLLDFANVKEAVVIAKTDEEEDKYLCAYLVSQNQWVASELREYLAKCLPEYMIPSYFVSMEKMPLTPQGKIDRNALPHPKKKIGESYVAPRNQIETQLVEIWSQVLKMESNIISIDSSFFHLGGHSLKATTLVSKIHKLFDVKVPLVEIFRIPTIRELAQYIRGKSKERHIAIEPTEDKEYYRLSSSQRRLYFLQQLAPLSIGYNLPDVIHIGQNLEWEKLEKTFTQLIERHESLRTSFHIIDQFPVQRIHARVEFKIEYPAHIQDQSQLKSTTDDFVRPFDLAQAPLLRVALIKFQNNHLLLVDMHHIISDGLSIQILGRDFSELYQDHVLRPLFIQYKDFAEWQYQEKNTPGTKAQEDFWLKEFSGEIPILNLPIDYTRPVLQVFDGNSLSFEISAQDTRALKEIASQGNATIFMVLLAIFNVLLAKLGNQEDVVVGTPIAGRRHADLEKLIGMFVNTLALRHYPSGELSFREFLRIVNLHTLDAFENQEYPFEELVEKSNVNRDMGRNPLFDVMFSLLNIHDSRDENFASQEQAEKQADNNYKNRSSKFDLSLYAMEVGPQLHFYFEYSTTLFKPQTIQRMITYFKEILSHIITSPATKLLDINWLPPAEKEQILYQFNHTAADYPQDKTIHQLFEEQVARTPHHIAIIGARDYPDITPLPLSYAQLNEKSNQLALGLQEKGVRPGTIVAIKMERSVELMIGIFAILKAGAAYLPIDPEYPETRIHYILNDSGVTLILTKNSIFEVLAEIRSTTGEYPNPRVFQRPADVRNLAYVIYTSGSTGNPKGVLIEHHALVNRLFWMQKKYPLDPGDTILQKTTVTFDVSVWELFWWSLGGATLCLLPPGGEKDPALMTQTIQEHRVTVMHFVPSMLNVFLDYLDTSGHTSRVASLKQVFASGEELTPQQVTNFNRLLYSTYSTKLANLYGPTEATIDVSYFDCSPHDPAQFSIIPIGKPINNICLYILDKYLHHQSLGVAGELCIGGVGLARGYLNRPQLTHEKFIQVPILSTLSPSPAILYKTGDLARWLPDGNIEFLGRLDFQVKVRGFRIELGEIEARLCQHEDIKEVVVLTIDDNTHPGGEKALCAFIVSPKELDAGELRNYLAQRLPAHMVPAFFKQVERIPLTPSGKTDRQALRSSGTRLGGGAQYLAPGSATEQRIARIWAEVLPADIKIGVHDNFFDIGGTSMDVIRISSKMTQEFQKEIPVISFYKYTTIRAMSDMLDHSEGSSPDIDGFSPEKQAERIERVEKGRVDRNKMRDLRQKSARR